MYFSNKILIKAILQTNNAAILYIFYINLHLKKINVNVTSFITSAERDIFIILFNHV
jgi:hypothetical protein